MLRGFFFRRGYLLIFGQLIGGSVGWLFLSRRRSFIRVVEFKIKILMDFDETYVSWGSEDGEVRFLFD